MALSTKDPDNDEKLNPAAWDESTGRRLSSAEQDAYDDTADNFDDTADDSQENANIEQAKNAEERGSGGSQTSSAAAEKPKKSQDEADTNNQSEEKGGSKRNKLAINFMKKKGPMALIGLLLAGGGGLFTALLSPGLAIVQIKEAVMEDLDDAVSAMDERTQHIFRAKMKGQVKGLCTKKVTVRCKYQTMSKTQLKKMAKAGLEVKVSPDRRTLPSGRYKVESISYRDSQGNKKTVSPDQFRERYLNDPHFRSAMNKFYSPRWMSVRDKVMDSVKNRFKLSFKRLINGKNKAEMRDQLNSNVKEGASERDGRKVTIKEKDDGKKVYVDENGREVTNGKGEVLDADVEEKKINDLKKLTGGGTRKMLSTGFKAANIYTGTQEAVCSVLKLMRFAGIASRNMKFAQYMRYAVPFLNTADSIKTGSATPEATEFVGDILTKKDMRDMVLSDTSLPTEQDSAGKTVIKEIANQNSPPVLEPVPNPHKGQDAFDSAGVKAAMYGTSTNLDMRESQASLSGNIGSTLVSLVDEMRKFPAFSESQCSFWTNPIVQGAGALLSVATILLSCVGGCAAVIPSIGKAAATTAVVMLITALISNQVSDLVNGESVNADSQGLDAGNAIFTGTAAFTSTSASTRGMNPISTPEEIAQSNKVSARVDARNAEIDRLAAQDTPYDIYNQYSFLGSIAWSLSPSVRASSQSIASAVALPLNILGSVPNWFAPSANALITSSPDRYKKCQDEVFTRMNLNSADMMCNIRWGMSEQQLNADPQKVVQWMIDSCQIDAVTGELNPSGKCAEGCQPGQSGNEQCQRTTTDEEAMAMLNSTPDQIAKAMDPESKADQPIATSSSTSASARLSAGDVSLPPGVTGDPVEINPEEDVRTYAHFLRYCRFGPEEGARQVNFGDPDAGDKSVLDGLTFGNNFSSVGKECLVANNCKPGQDPNNAFPRESEGSLRFCRPAQYDIYATYTLDKTIEDGMDQEDDESGGGDDGSGLVTGEAKDLARQVANNPNIEFANPATKEALMKFADTGQATNACGEKYAINPLLSGVILANARNWKIKINNFGFQSDRNFCDSSPSNQHRMGNAIDVNGIEKIGGGSAGGSAWGSINYSGSQTPVVTSYATDWMDNLATKEPTRGRSGQLGCGSGYNLIRIKKPTWKGIDGLLHFSDSCDHLHIDVGDRVDQNKR